MREIKFRGREINNNKWVYGYYVRSDEGEEGVKYVIQFTDGYEYAIPETIEQYTGLKDKNGKEIYEGDIVKYTFDIPNSSLATENGLKVRIAEVFWCEWRSSFAVYGDKNNKLLSEDLFRYVRNGNTVEIIGNIYENSELIKEIK